MKRSERRDRLSSTAVLAVVVVLGLLVGGCGSSTAGDAAAPTSTGAGATGTFRIGLEAPLTGTQAELGQGMLGGARLAATELNEAGGLDGRQIEIVPIDDQADPAVGENAARAAIAAGLDGVVGPYNSGVGARTLPLYVDAGLVPLRLTSADETAGLGFTLQPMTSQIAPAAVTAITQWSKAKSVGIVVDSTQAYTAQASQAMQALLPGAGVKITSVESIAPGATSYGDALGKVLAQRPELVYVVAYYPEAGTIAKDLAAANTDVRCLVDYGGFDNGYISTAGQGPAQRCAVVGVPAPGDFPNAGPRVESYGERIGSQPGVWSPYTYDSVRLLVDAATRAGATDATAVRGALAATTGWQGWTGTVAFQPETGNREPAPVTVNSVDGAGEFRVDESWAAAVGFGF